MEVNKYFNFISRYCKKTPNFNLIKKLLTPKIIEKCSQVLCCFLKQISVVFC